MGLFFIAVPLMNGNLDAIAYKDFLDNSVFPTLFQQSEETHFLFEDDRSTKNGFPLFGVKKTDCRVQSPDLKPTHHLWD